MHYKVNNDIESILKDGENDSKIITAKNVSIYIPKRYGTYHLLTVTDVVEALGTVMVTWDDKYCCTLNVPAVLTFCPSSMEDVTLEGEKYLRCDFIAGDTFIRSTHVVRNVDCLYALYTENIGRKHRFPTIGYEALSDLFIHSKSLVGVSMGGSIGDVELLVSLLARDPKDKFLPYRYTTDKSKKPILFGIYDPAFVATSATARIVGSWFEQGLASALLHKTKKPEHFEDILRGKKI